jgi:hypothetical protein
MMGVKLYQNQTKHALREIEIGHAPTQLALVSRKTPYLSPSWKACDEILSWLTNRWASLHGN